MKTYFKPSRRITNTTSLSQTRNPFPPHGNQCTTLWSARAVFESNLQVTRSSNCTPFFSGRLGNLNHAIIIPSSSFGELFQQKNPICFTAENYFHPNSTAASSANLPQLPTRKRLRNSFEATSICIPTQSPNKQGN